MNAIDDLEVLNGATVQRASILDGTIYLETDGLTFRLEPEGDCCASCFVADIDGSEALVGGKVLRVEDLEQKTIRDEECDVVDTWGHRIHTDRGICTIGMRVEHNGYYGGRLNVYVVDGVPEKAEPLKDFAG